MYCAGECAACDCIITVSAASEKIVRRAASLALRSIGRAGTLRLREDRDVGEVEIPAGLLDKRMTRHVTKEELAVLGQTRARPPKRTTVPQASTQQCLAATIHGQHQGGALLRNVGPRGGLQRDLVVAGGGSSSCVVEVQAQ